MGLADPIKLYTKPLFSHPPQYIIENMKVEHEPSMQLCTDTERILIRNYVQVEADRIWKQCWVKYKNKSAGCKRECSAEYKNIKTEDFSWKIHVSSESNFSQLENLETNIRTLYFIIYCSFEQFCSHTLFIEGRL